MNRPDLLMSLFLGLPLGPRIESGDVKAKGEVSLYAALVELIEPLSLNFPIVTP